jgi:predicted nucleic acid-binding protein
VLSDVVIDTDVMLHAENPEVQRHSDSRRLLNELRSCETFLCLDEGFEPEESKNRSAIASEYLSRLPPGSLGLILLSECATSRRIRLLPTKVERAANRLINQLVYDPTDRKFVKVACNSNEKVVTTHDRHISDARAELNRRLAVRVLDAGECCVLI